MVSFHKTKSILLAIVAVCAFIISCNKDLPEAVPIQPPPNGSSPTLADLLADPSLSIFKAAVTRSGFEPLLADTSLRLTVFAPSDPGLQAVGITMDVVNGMPVDQLAALISYHIVPQSLSSSAVPTNFPNFQYPTLLNPVPTLSPLFRLTTFPSKRGSTVWVNNIPVVKADVNAVNGVMHVMATVIAPPSQDLWTRISTDTHLTYLKASVERADSGVAPGARLLDALSLAANPSAIASNLTIFAPNDNAFQMFLTGALTQAFIGQGFPPANAQAAAIALVTAFGPLLISNPASIPDVAGFPPGLGNSIAAVITPTLAKGIVAYHVISSQSGSFTPPGLELFSVNLSTTPTALKTLLNSGVPPHPGVTAQATFGPTGVTAMTVKGLANATASNVLINPLPGGTSDQHYINGVIHVIDQVLLPQ